MSRVECIVANDDGGQAVEVVLMEPRPFRPFKSSEEYLIAMKEDLAEWLLRLYQLEIDAENFMDVLEDGVVLCKVRVTDGRRVKNRFPMPAKDINRNLSTVCLPPSSPDIKERDRKRIL